MFGWGKLDVKEREGKVITFSLFWRGGGLEGFLDIQIKGRNSSLEPSILLPFLAFHFLLFFPLFFPAHSPKTPKHGISLTYGKDPQMKLVDLV